MSHRCFALQVNTNEPADGPGLMLVKFTEENLNRLRLRHAQFKHLKSAAGDEVHSVTYWNHFDTRWLEQGEEGPIVKLQAWVICSGGVAEIVEEAHNRYIALPEVRTEYELIEVDENGLVFYANIRHTEVRAYTDVLAWDWLLQEAPKGTSIAV